MKILAFLLEINLLYYHQSLYDHSQSLSSLFHDTNSKLNMVSVS